MTKLENNIQTYEGRLPKAIVLAFQRVNVQPERIMGISDDVKRAFPKIEEKDLIEAIKRGALGEFGRTYRMSTQEVCIWVREHLKKVVGTYNVDDILKEYKKIK